jgi:hypothetical protein
LAIVLLEHNTDNYNIYRDISAFLVYQNVHTGFAKTTRAPHETRRLPTLAIEQQTAKRHCSLSFFFF